MTPVLQLMLVLGLLISAARLGVSGENRGHLGDLLQPNTGIFTAMPLSHVKCVREA